MLRDGFSGLKDHYDVCVVGAGPVGITLGLALSRAGQSVLLLESGGLKPEPLVQSLSDAELANPKTHDSMRIAIARRLGGTSNLWGGRCIPFDPVDFLPRPGLVDGTWPIGHDDIAPFYDAACGYADAGVADFSSPAPELPAGDGSFRFDALERWSNTPRLQVLHARELRASPNLDVCLHAVVTGLNHAENGAVTGLRVSRPDGAQAATLKATHIVLAAGGVETTRLLLAGQREAPARFGGMGGPLGRYYMGHVVGQIAGICLANRTADNAFDFRIDPAGTYVRRRFVASAALQLEAGILNTGLWPVVPPIWDASHGSAILSAIYLAMSYPSLGRRFIAEALRKRHMPPVPVSRLPHVRNVASNFLGAAGYIPSFLWRRYMTRSRIPGFYLRNRHFQYGLSFHSEQWPNPDSRVSLTAGTDRLGLPKLRIDYRFHARDVDSILKTHDLFGAWLERTGLGRLTHQFAPEERGAAILQQAKHGAHQIGLTRMAPSPALGIVDRDLRVFGCPNLFVASSSVLPTSGQANPTLITMALALRLAQHLTMNNAAASSAAQ